MLIPRILEGTGLGYSEAMARADLRARADRDLSRRSLIGIFSYFVVWVIIFFATELEHANDGLMELLGVMLAAGAIGRLYLVLNFAKLYAVNPRRWRGLFCAGTIISAGIWGMRAGDRF